MDYTDNFRQIRQRAMPPERRIRSVITVEGEEIPFDGRFPTEPGKAQRRIDPATPREADIDTTGPKTHRIITLTERKVCVGPDEHVQQLGADLWVTGDIAALLERNRLARIVEAKDAREAPAETVIPPAARKQAPVLHPGGGKPRKALTAEQKARKIAALAKAREVKKARQDASAAS